MRPRQRRLGCVLAAVAACCVPGGSRALANLVLFPGTPSEVVDGGPGDISGMAEMIVIDPSSPILVPGTTDLYFSGMVRHAAGGTLTIGQALGLRALVVSEVPPGLPGAGTPATLHYTGTGTFILPAAVEWVTYEYPTLDPAGVAGTSDLAIHFQGPLDTTPGGGTLASTGQRLSASIRAETWREWTTGLMDLPITASWSNPGQLNAPLLASGFNSAVGDYDDNPGRMRIMLEDVVLEPGERFEFPGSLSAGLLVPEPGSALLLLGAAFGLMARRRSRRRA